MNYDIIIDNVLLVDGTGKKAFPAAVGIWGDKIATVAEPGQLREAATIIRGTEQVLAPGFIDIHSHDDLVFWQDPYNRAKLYQGVTTVVTGMCGFSPFPLAEDKERRQEFISVRETRSGRYPWQARDLTEYKESLVGLKPAINVVPCVGHGSLRNAVMGFSPQQPTPEQLTAMENLLRQAMLAGAFGLSTGLIYPPGAYAETAELITLTRVLAGYGGRYFSHIRSESQRMPGALNEAITIGRQAGVPVHIGHFKCLGKGSWGEATNRLHILDQAREEGVSVTWDQYPYTANSTGLVSLLPPDTQKKGIKKLVQKLAEKDYRAQIKERIEKETDWENFYHHAGWEGVMFSEVPGWEDLEGKRVGRLLAAGVVSDPFDLVFDALQASAGSATMITFTMSESDVETIIKHPATAVGSDGMAGTGKEHPRMYGTFPRVIRLFVQQERVLPLAEAIRKMTSWPASILGLQARGVIKEGAYADLVMFDPEEFCDAATYENPRQLAKGLNLAMVNGSVVLDKSGLTKKRNGAILAP